MNILITGGTGFVGKRLISHLASYGYHAFVLTRSPHKYTNDRSTTYLNYSIRPEELPTIHAVINLAGDSLFGYWTEKKKQLILSSRLQITEKLIHIMSEMKQKPNVLINASAIGYYGTSEEKIFTEATTTPGNDFLADVATSWENKASNAAALGIRTVYVRFGVILEKTGGALPLMALPVSYFAGGKIGKGEQWISWIHLDDVIKIILFCIHHTEIAGPINATAPSPKRNKDFMKVLAKSLKRPYWFPTPSSLIRLTLGEMSELITKGQYVSPDRLLAYGYTFTYPELEKALHTIYHYKNNI
ncbi:TIGR01777 family oxidoreductase [Virgibacillus sp. W0430]|uniref:TIGR01777 family oxidoreductase n=1 Tax=Virgibacillus sp. W0430 TaxID=3391580 RepID=UPI003F46148B